MNAFRTVTRVGDNAFKGTKLKAVIFTGYVVG